MKAGFLTNGFVAAIGASMTLLGVASPAAAQSQREEAVAQAQSMAASEDPIARVAGRIALGNLRPEMARAERKATEEVLAAAKAEPVRAVCTIASIDNEGVAKVECKSAPMPTVVTGPIARP